MLLAEQPCDLEMRFVINEGEKRAVAFFCCHFDESLEKDVLLTMEFLSLDPKADGCNLAYYLTDCIFWPLLRGIGFPSTKDISSASQSGICSLTDFISSILSLSNLFFFILIP